MTKQRCNHCHSLLRIKEKNKITSFLRDTKNYAKLTEAELLQMNSWTLFELRLQTTF